MQEHSPYLCTRTSDRVPMPMYQKYCVVCMWSHSHALLYLQNLNLLTRTLNTYVPLLQEPGI